MKRLWICIKLICLFALIPVFAEQAVNPARRAAQEPEVLARVGHQVITVDDFVDEVKNRAARDPNLGSPEGRVQLLVEMVRHRALVLKAKEAGYDQRADVKAAYERLLVSAYLRETRNRQLEGLTVSDEEVAAHYAAHAESYRIPARYRAAAIFYEVGPAATPERRAELEAKARATLEEAAGLDPSILHFGPLAVRDSDHRASRYRGGVIGWLDRPTAERSRWHPELLEAIFALRHPGELGPLVSTPEGLYLVRLVDREESRPQPLEQLAAGIRQHLLHEKRAALGRALDIELAEELGVSLELERLQALDVSALSSPPMPPPLPAEAAGRQHSPHARPGS